MPKQPPVTPSPHRFLPSQKRKDGPNQASRPDLNASAVPKSASSGNPPKPQPPPFHRSQWTSNSSQFAATPHFSVGKPRTSTTTQRSPSPQKPTLIQALSRSKRPTDDVEESGEQDEDDEMLELDNNAVLPTTEHRDHLPFSPKRRRLDDSTFDNRHETPFKRPQHPASHTAPFSTSTSLPFENQLHNRPAFIRPSPAPVEPTEPLPETFSPHRRGQKFVPGGLAATLQQWVVETGEAAVQSRRGQGYLLGEEWVLRLKVDDVEGRAPFTVSGEGMRVLLAANGREEVRAGSTIGIRAPVWQVEMDGREWKVGVDWKVLSR